MTKEETFKDALKKWKKLPKRKLKKLHPIIRIILNDCRDLI